MPEITKHEPGTYSWSDMMVKDLAPVKKFYAAVLGWTFRDVPMGEGMFYTMCDVGGREVAGISLEFPNAPPGMTGFWTAYLDTPDVSAVAAKAKELGGKVMLEPMDVMDQGRMAVIQDPTGAALGFWQAAAQTGSKVTREHGTMCWLELATRNVDVASGFYTRLLGNWTLQQSKNSTMPYLEICVNKSTNIGGVMPMSEEWGDVPSHWSMYYQVNDVAKAIADATASGGKVLFGPKEIPTVGTFAMLQDPGGAMIYVLQFAPNASMG